MRAQAATRRRRRPTFQPVFRFVSVGTATLTAAVVALVVALSGAGAPSLAQAAAIANLRPSAPAPATDPRAPTKLLDGKGRHPALPQLGERRRLARRGAALRPHRQPDGDDRVLRERCESRRLLDRVLADARDEARAALQSSRPDLHGPDLHHPVATAAAPPSSGRTGPHLPADGQSRHVGRAALAAGVPRIPQAAGLAPAVGVIYMPSASASRWRAR